ncbi:hypothetical protein DQM68_19350 [Leptospira mayottensis]|uniref:Uncharacterized protein n=2 Tax=Leptospira mayottensis TaxID=1137606 RepID=A0AA87SYC8_9LEPT|nr:hypothetical protein DQM68_19350 [Leptospira mayottensis]AZQ03955.1 hypothetical protein LEP1GSC190_17945 [Leptospira mayottensis 200901116]EKR99181.1 hypothetical protein LEP1GSC125_3734 [Leptospira mayottensis 200901122]AXR66296.1 hypothetical protein DQM28_18885 [Leptospira mayottensis]AXR70079.1 hypothetical protein DPV73_19015 [Leptospira mayottensis]
MLREVKKEYSIYGARIVRTKLENIYSATKFEKSIAEGGLFLNNQYGKVDSISFLYFALY